MDSPSSSGRSLPAEPRRRKAVFSPSQKDALQASFATNPYPGISTRQKLAEQTGLAEPRIHVWFQNQRRRLLKQKRLEAEPWPQEGLPREERRRRTAITAWQTAVLVGAFESNRFPGIATREALSRQTGLPESRIHIWFQNRRARHPGRQEPRAPAPVAARAGPTEDPSAQPPLALETPTRAAAVAPAPAGALSHAQSPLWPPYQGHSQGHAGLAGAHSLWRPELPGPGPAQQLASHPAQWWGPAQGPQAVQAPCPPGEAPAAPPQATPRQSPPRHEQSPASGEPGPGLQEPPGEPAPGSCLLDELLSAPEFQALARPFVDLDAQEEDLSAEPEPPLDQEEFQALLDQLLSSPEPQL
ncbi:double homeobox protein 4 [Otolemur garnettii]|uniref:double homeobox protein 4 n=1 Tax=Otolemur garnettii TaxID=30611 RepID=UPI0002741664|nr:double homeobox protein 4 [Otolemur garnettii]